MLGVPLDNETGDGVRLPIFNYTGKVVLSIKDYVKQKKKEIHHGCQLQGNSPSWFMSQCIAGDIYTNNPVINMRLFGKAASTKLKEKGIETVDQFLTIAQQDLQTLLAIQGLAQQQLDCDILNATYRDRDLPQPLNHCKELNP